MHIAIEGLDGVGKTTVAKILADRLNFEFIEKPLHLLTDSDNKLDNYLRIIAKLNSVNDPIFNAVFYGAGNLYLSKIAHKRHVITDRHICSTYYWNAVKENEEFFDYLHKACGNPNLTVILFANVAERIKRITARNPKDPDFCKVVDDDYQKILECVQKYQMRYMFIDSSDLTVSEVIEMILTEWRSLNG